MAVSSRTISVKISLDADQFYKDLAELKAQLIELQGMTSIEATAEVNALVDKHNLHPINIRIHKVPLVA